MPNYTPQYEQLYDFLSAPVMPADAEGALTFGRKDLLVAQKVVDLSREGFAKYVVISGGVGKDSGDLEIPEATYLANGAEQLAAEQGVALAPVYTETKAKNGGQNVRNSLTLMRENGLPYNAGLTAVAHATSLRRLAAGIEHEAVVQNDPIAAVHRVPTNYNFDPANPADQKEAVDEMWRLIDWPSKDFLQPQHDLPQDLVDFTVEQKSQQQ